MNQERNTAPRTPASGGDGLGLRPLSARSVVASVLMGTHPPELPTAALVRLGESLGIAPGTTRVALSRMVAAGELAPVPALGTGGYRLTGPALLSRQRTQDQALDPATAAWDGQWRMAVVTGGSAGPRGGRSAAERSDLRRALLAARFAEWREGVWLRPANLPAVLIGPGGDPALREESCRWLTTRPDEDPAALAGELWDLTGWAARARTLLAVTGADDFTTAAALLRHLRTDPLLPAELLPPAWPSDDLRARYAAHLKNIRAFIAEKGEEIP